MRKTNGWTWLRSAAIALGIGAAGASGADAAGMSSTSAFVDYNTTGSITDLGGVTGRNVVSFKVTGGSFTTPSYFSLGEFLVDGLNDGESTTYNNTPFAITYQTTGVDHKSVDPSVGTVKLTGILNGSLAGAGQSSLKATFDPVVPASFQAGPYLHQLTTPLNPVLLAPSSTNGGRTTVQGQVIASASPVPEPATLAVFLTAAAALGIRRRLLARV